ncbi:MAG: serine hydrolase, partial [Flavobacterium sp.]
MKNSFKIVGLLGLGSLIYLCFINYPKLDLISGFSAKSMASVHFIDGRSQASIEQGDNDIPLVKLATNQIDDKASFATASVFGLKTRKAIYRNGLGATLIDDSFDMHKPYDVPKRTPNPSKLPYPYGTSEAKDSLFANIDYALLQKTVANAFDVGAKIDKRSRAVLVIYKDHIIAEQYGPGFSKNS